MDYQIQNQSPLSRLSETCAFGLLKCSKFLRVENILQYSHKSNFTKINIFQNADFSQPQFFSKMYLFLGLEKWKSRENKTKYYFKRKITSPPTKNCLGSTFQM